MWLRCWSCASARLQTRAAWVWNLLCTAAHAGKRPGRARRQSVIALKTTTVGISSLWSRFITAPQQQNNFMAFQTENIHVSVHVRVKLWQRCHLRDRKRKWLLFWSLLPQLAPTPTPTLTPSHLHHLINRTCSSPVMSEVIYTAYSSSLDSKLRVLLCLLFQHCSCGLISEFWLWSDLKVLRCPGKPGCLFLTTRLPHPLPACFRIKSVLFQLQVAPGSQTWH